MIVKLILLLSVFDNWSTVGIFTQGTAVSGLERYGIIS